MNKIADTIQKRKLFKKLTLGIAMKNIEKFIDTSTLPRDWQTKDFLEFLNGFANFRELYPDNQARIRYIKNSRYRTMLLFGMHFQDLYNFEDASCSAVCRPYIAADEKCILLSLQFRPLLPYKYRKNIFIPPNPKCQFPFEEETKAIRRRSKSKLILCRRSFII
jgi:uncharacterized radical SAM superfamily Fe-S cluster-containing enzyme